MDVWKKVKEGKTKDATCKMQPELEFLENTGGQLLVGQHCSVCCFLLRRLVWFVRQKKKKSTCHFMSSNQPIDDLKKDQPRTSQTRYLACQPVSFSCYLCNQKSLLGVKYCCGHILQTASLRGMNLENKYAEIFHETNKQQKKTILTKHNMTTLLTHNDVVSSLMEQIGKNSK